MTTQTHTQTEQPTGCCKPFNPVPWQNAEITWKKKIFVKDHVISFLRIPLNLERKMTHDIDMIERANAMPSRPMMLMDENSLWGADIYIDVSKRVPGAQTTTLSGTFIPKVFEGPYEDAWKWEQEMREYVESQDEEVEKIFFYYPMCPKCSKAYGKNYAVLMAKIK